MSKLYFDTLAEANDMIAFEQSEQFLTAMYLFDETELNHYIQENKDERMIASLIYIDNYDEALDSIEEVKRSLLVALVDRKINKHFSGRGRAGAQDRKGQVLCSVPPTSF